MNVLILDRSKELTKRIIDHIEETNEGISFCSAASHSGAVNHLKQYNPDVVLLDLNFCGNTATELLQTIKQRNGNTVVIIWYNHASYYGLKICKEQGADYLLNKYDEFEKIPELITTIRLKALKNY